MTSMSSTLFTAAFILGAIFIFIFLFKLLHKKGHDKKLNKQKAVFADVAWKNKLEISEKESINNYLLAIDKINFVLLYIDFSNPKEEVLLVDLWRIRSVKVNTEDNSVYEERRGRSILVDKHINKLQVELTLAGIQPKANLVLYECNDGMQDILHIKRRAEYWKGLIDNCIKEVSVGSKQLAGN